MSCLQQVITVRGTSFEAANMEGGSAGTEDVAVGDLPVDLSQFLGQELSKSDRPELTAAKVSQCSTLANMLYLGTEYLPRIYNL